MNVDNSLRKIGHDGRKREYGVNRGFGFCLVLIYFCLFVFLTENV